MAAPKIGITFSIEEKAAPYIAAVEAAGGSAVLVDLRKGLAPDSVLAPLQGLVLSGGADVTPGLYGAEVDTAAKVKTSPERDEHEFPLIRAAFARDMPVLGICRGMQALNVALGGKLIQHVNNHRPEDVVAVEAPAYPREGLDDRSPHVGLSGPARKPKAAGPNAEEDQRFLHKVFVPPGSRLTTILGLCGFLDVNSYHHQGLTIREKAPNVLVGAYSLKDGIIECLECPKTMFNWVVGVQWHPERNSELPAYHQKLFTQLITEASASH